MSTSTSAKPWHYWTSISPWLSEAGFDSAYKAAHAKTMARIDGVVVLLDSDHLWLAFNGLVYWAWVHKSLIEEKS